MVYLIVDPNMLLMPPVETIGTSNLKQFIFTLKEWSDASEEYIIEFGFTSNCKKALQTAMQSSLNQSVFQDLVARLLPRLNTEEILKAFLPFLEQLLEHSYLDKLLKKLESEMFYWDFESIMLSPTEYLSRLTTPSLQAAFKEMIGLVAFARNNGVLPLAELSNLRLLTTFSENEGGTWAHNTDYTLLVYLNYAWVIDDSVPNWEELQNNTKMDDTLHAVFSSEMLKGIARTKTFKTVDDAVEAAAEQYPNCLILTRRAEKTARQSGYQNPKKIYDALKGLVEVWFVRYEQDGNDKEANNLYYEQIGYEISAESQQVNQNLQLRREREVIYKGKTIFAERHVKLGKGPNAARIHFAVIEDNGQKKIIIARAGTHAATATRPH